MGRRIGFLLVAALLALGGGIAVGAFPLGRVDRAPDVATPTSPAAADPALTTADTLTTEIVAFDPSTDRLFVVNAASATVDVLNLADPAAPKVVPRTHWYAAPARPDNDLTQPPTSSSHGVPMTR